MIATALERIGSEQYGIRSMSEIRKANVEGATYFVTLTVDGWVDVFTRKELVAELVRNVQYCQAYKVLKLFAYVIMSTLPPLGYHARLYRIPGLLPPLGYHARP